MSVDESGFDALLAYLKSSRGFDFASYKRPSLIRRIGRRVQAVHLDDYADYMDYLEVHPEEFSELFNFILINVTAFFRDEPAWDYLRDEIIPALAQSSSPIRVWSAGCASGEEPYSVAMLLAEAIGRDAYRERVKIYATDVDDQALNEARAATYTPKQVSQVPGTLLDRYFARDGDKLIFDKELRRSVIFGRHDLLQDAPISRINILICRNALMYFNTEAQRRILARFHFALAEHGVLFLGKAEMLLTHAQLFEPLDLRRRFFRKVMKDGWRDRLAILSRAAGEQTFDPERNEALYPSAFDVNPMAQFVVDGNGVLAMFNERSRVLFNFTATDIGRPLQDLDVSFRPVELRSVIEQVVEHRRPVALRAVPWESVGREPRHFDVHIAAINGMGDRPPAVSVSFADVSRLEELQGELTRVKQDLETAYEELQSTNEELETTNEELQSTVEELETTNEELQSTNEELETMNEELQSTNEELQRINAALRDRSTDLNKSNAFLESVLAGVRSGVVVVDRDLSVIAWNHRAEDLWGLREEEVKGQNFLNLDIGLPTGALRPAIRACLADGRDCHEIVVPATNRRGQAIEIKVKATALFDGGRDSQPHGVILMMDEQRADAASA